MRIEKITRIDIKSLEDLKIIKKEGQKFPTFIEGKIKKLFKGKVLVYVEKIQGAEGYYYNYWIYCDECEGWYRIISDYKINTSHLKNLIELKIINFNQRR